MRREWHSLSRELRLQLFLPTNFWDIMAGKMPSLSGKVGTFDFFCEMQKRNHGREQVIYTHISFAIKNIGTRKTVSVYLEDVFAKLGKAIGGQDVQFGDKAFDDAEKLKIMISVLWDIAKEINKL
jgi:hypothetical protein